MGLKCSLTGVHAPASFCRDQSGGRKFVLFLRPPKRQLGARPWANSIGSLHFTKAYCRVSRSAQKVSTCGSATILTSSKVAGLAPARPPFLPPSSYIPARRLHRWV